jgi:enoyl-CoA hydratase/carnithine racemase
MPEERVRVEIDSAGIADVRLNRGEKLNAVDDAMFEQVAALGRSLAGDRALRAVVLSGEGRGFCAGLDTSSFGAAADGGGEAKAFNPFATDPGEPANHVQQFAWVWRDLPVPVIAAVHGVCFGAGIQLALAADIRFVTPDAKLSIMEMKWGLIPDVTGSQTLRHLLPLDVLKELTFTARTLSGTEALELGLATHVSDTPRESAYDLAREIATRSPDAIRSAKQLLNQTATASPAEGLALEASLQRELIGGANQLEAIMANLQKRPAAFKDPK